MKASNFGFVFIGCATALLMSGCINSIPISSRQHESIAIREKRIGDIQPREVSTRFVASDAKKISDEERVAAENLALIYSDIEASKVYLKYRSEVDQLLIDGQSRFWFRFTNCEYFVIEHVTKDRGDKEDQDTIVTSDGKYFVVESGVMASCISH